MTQKTRDQKHLIPGQCRTCHKAFKYLFKREETLDEDISSSGLTKSPPVYRSTNLHQNFLALEESAATGCPTCRIFRQRIVITLSRDEYIRCRAESLRFSLVRRRKITSSGHWHTYLFIGVANKKPLDFDYRPDQFCHFAENCWHCDGSSSRQILDAQRFRMNGRWKQNTLHSDSSQIERVDSISGHCPPITKMQEGVARSQESPGDQFESTMSQIRQWLFICPSHHLCKRRSGFSNNGDIPFMPTRLVNIESHQNKLHLRLILPSCLSIHQQNQIQYAALSYTWGHGVDHYVTTTTNYELHLLNIEYGNLPKTLQHACHVVHGLGLRYIWIDALCIVQSHHGATDDWAREAIRMEEVYRSALLTISATSATNVHEGFLNNHDSSCFPTFSCSIGDLSPNEFVCDFHKPQDTPIRPRPPDWSQLLDLKSILARRGWCFQERYLSSRIVHFTEHAIFWDCVSLQASDYEPDGCSSLKHGSIKDKGIQFRRGFASKPVTVIESEWYEIVQDYSRRETTEPSDRLPAISGIAKRFCTVLQDAYLAGTWRRTLPKALSWRTCTHRESNFCQLDTGRRRTWCPTWSWASVETPVRFQFLWIERNGSFNARGKPKFGVELDLNVLETITIPAGCDEFGKLTSGSLKLCGRLLPLCINATNIKNSAYLDDINMIRLSSGYIYMDEKDDAKHLRDNGSEHRMLRYLPLYWWRYKDDSSRTYYHLALERIGFDKDGMPKYKRIGLFVEPTFANLRTEDGAYNDQKPELLILV